MAQINIEVGNKVALVSDEKILLALGYTPEDDSNKVIEFSDTPSNNYYPSEKLVKDALDLKADTGVSGLFISHDSKTIIVTNGVITSIV